MTTSRQLALVTGASSGIGRELARLFANDQYDLIIAAEDAGIETAATDLRLLGTDVQAIRTDLSTSEGVQELSRAITATGRPLAAACLNAGVGQGGAFVDTPLDAELAMIDLNVRGTTQLAKLLLRDMAVRDAGKILITSSIASTMPGPYQAVYNATKSYLQSFAEALHSEMSDTNVTVTSLMPGVTDTNFFQRAGLMDTPVGQSSKDDPAEVAKAGYEAMMAGKQKVVAESLLTKAQAAASVVLPDRVKAAMHSVMAKPKD